MATRGQRIAKLRVRANLTQTKLAKLLDVGRGAVWNWENDIRLPGAHRLENLAKALGTTVGELWGGRRS